MKKTAEAYWAEKLKASNYFKDLQKSNLEITKLRNSSGFKKGEDMLQKNFELKMQNENHFLKVQKRNWKILQKRLSFYHLNHLN